jgi:DNA-binding protein HU-beta
MNKKELIEAIANQSELKKVEVLKVINAFVSISSEMLASNDYVRIDDFGCLSVSKRETRNFYNPITKENISVPGKKAVKFKMYKHLSDKLQ